VKKLLALAFLIMFVSGCNDTTICVCSGDLKTESLQNEFCNSIKEYVSDNVEMFVAHTQLVKDVKNKRTWVYFELSAKDVDRAYGYGYFHEETGPIKMFYERKNINFKMVNMGTGIEPEDLEENVPVDIRYFLFKDWDKYK